LKKNENVSNIRALEIIVLSTAKGCPKLDKIKSEYIRKYLLKFMFSKNKIFYCRGNLSDELDGMEND
jgi:hypothetical protein